MQLNKSKPEFVLEHSEKGGNIRLGPDHLVTPTEEWLEEKVGREIGRHDTLVQYFLPKTYGVLKRALSRTSAFIFSNFQVRNELIANDDDDVDPLQDVESDFVVVTPGLVFCVECKLSLRSAYGKDSFEKAVRQLDRVRRVLEKVGVTGKLARSVCYVDARQKYARNPCSDCKPYLLRLKREGEFLDSFATLLKLTSPPTSTERFKSVVRDLLIISSSPAKGYEGIESRVADAFATRHSQFIETPAKTAFFWSPEQYGILKKKFLIFTSRSCKTDIHYIRITY